MNKLFEYIDKQRIIDWLDSMGVENYTINKDLIVDVKGDVNLRNKNLLEITVQFGVVNGDFIISYNELVSLTGSPKQIHGDFIATCNDIKILDENTPDYVGGVFCVNYNFELSVIKKLPNCKVINIGGTQINDYKILQGYLNNNITTIYLHKKTVRAKQDNLKYIKLSFNNSKLVKP